MSDKFGNYDGDGPDPDGPAEELGDAPAPAGGSEILTPEDFRFTLLSIPDIEEDHPHVADLLAHDAALRERAETMYQQGFDEGFEAGCAKTPTQREAEAERDRLAALIKDAPHALTCHMGYCQAHKDTRYHCATRRELAHDGCDVNLPCDCWKAAARGEEKP